MPRPLLGFAVIVAFALPCVAEQTGTNSEMLIRLNLCPAPRQHRRFDTGFCLSSGR